MPNRSWYYIELNNANCIIRDEIKILCSIWPFDHSAHFLSLTLFQSRFIQRFWTNKQKIVHTSFIDIECAIISMHFSVVSMCVIYSIDDDKNVCTHVYMFNLFIFGCSRLWPRACSQQQTKYFTHYFLTSFRVTKTFYTDSHLPTSNIAYNQFRSMSILSKQKWA